MNSRERLRVAVAEGDGIGPEIVRSAVAIARAALGSLGAGSLVEWVDVDAGVLALQRTGQALPDESLARLESCDALVLGPVDHATYPRHRDGRRQNPSGEIRKHFDLFANIRPAKTVPGIPAVASEMDLVVVRENTEGFYSDRNMFRGYGEFRPTEDVALTVGVFTRRGVERVVRHAFELASARRGELTVVHKANVLPETTGMYLEAARRLAPSFPAVVVRDEHVDAMAALLVRDPASFDVVVTENLFGDILSDLTVQLAGSLGMAGSLNAGEAYAMAQAAHGSAPDIAGSDRANPCSLVSSVAMLLRWLAGRTGETAFATASATIDAALIDALGHERTPDLGGDATTTSFTEAVLDRLPAHVPHQVG
ncbi:isocitrate/isopropylmalate dehydrogenase family protein [Amycolatopsis pigmentata]|uniref:Isocitrate/isopropylmalate dehydrogenase family protein n=1 Tax=Amycolatopsis pigmentata TaxID=450801 RepID=A0ABW5FP56_9PSEU